MKPATQEPARPLCVLMVEDNPSDAHLLMHELKRVGREVRLDVVSTREGLLAALRGGGHDVVLSDYNLVGWNGLDVLRVLQEQSAPQPFILVTGSLGDEKTAECIKLGAADFVLKDRLNRLPHAITRALEEKALREQRVAAEEALRQSEQRYRSLVQGAVYGIYRSSLEDRFVEVNPALVAMLGYDSPEEVLALDLSRDLYADPEVRDHLIHQYERTKRVVDVEVPWKRKDGKVIIARLSGRAVLDQKGETEGLEMIAENVTERRSLERQLQQAQKMEAVGRLAGGIAHDFNNLLTVIRGYAELMLEDTDREKMRSRAQNIIKASDRTAALTRQLLAFSRKQVLWPQVLDLNAVMAETQKMLPQLIG